MEIGDSRGSDELQRQEVVVTAAAVDALESQRRFRSGHYVYSCLRFPSYILFLQMLSTHPFAMHLEARSLNIQRFHGQTELFWFRKREHYKS